MCENSTSKENLAVTNCQPFKGAPKQTARTLAQKAYCKKCSILDAMYPQQKYARDWMRIKKKLDEKSRAEKIKYLFKCRAKENERRYTQIYRTGSKSKILAQSS